MERSSGPLATFVVLVLLVGGAAAPPVSFAGPLAPVVFTHGVASGEATADSVILWTRVDRRTAVRAEVAADADFRDIVRRRVGHATEERDFAVHIPIEGLDPATKYYYRFRAAATVSEIGTFRTAPTWRQSTNVR